MQKKVNFIIFVICAILVIVSAFYDLSFSQLIYNGENFFNLFFEKLGELPLYIGINFCSTVICIYFTKKINVKFYDLSIIVFTMILSLCTAFYMFSKICEGFLWASVIGIFALIYNFILVKIIARVNQKALEKLYVFCLKLLFYIIVLLFANRLIKLLWGRIRFYALLEENNLDLFMPFWQLDVFSGNFSFYSGHITSGCVVLPCVFLSQKLGFCSTRRSFFLGLISYILFIILLAYSRISIGAHFLSDTIFAFIFAYIFYLMIFCPNKILTKKYKS